MNNNVENLEWCTSEYNHQYGTRNERHARSMMKKVDAYTVDGEFVKRFDSLKKASEELDLDASAVTKVCKGKIKYTKGYIFKYA